MNYTIKTIGGGKPSMAVVGCLHGDEIIGKKVVDELGDVKLKQGSLSLIIANNKALRKNKRFIKKDLNRSFPGRKNGDGEEKLAYSLVKILRSFDYVVDLHATDSNVGSLSIVTKLSNDIKNFLRYVPVKRVAFIKESDFSKGNMIDFCKAGVSLEYGPDKTGGNFKKALADVQVILKNLGLLDGDKKLYPEKELYTVSGVYTVGDGFVQNNKLRNFCLIDIGQEIGKLGGSAVVSKKEFYPLFLGKGAYEGTLALVADKKENITL